MQHSDPARVHRAYKDRERGQPRVGAIHLSFSSLTRLSQI
jgi:hypothetical protein